MGRLVIVPGDLLQSTETAICHQVNCQNAMGSGVAKALYEKWPEVKEQYHKYCHGAKPEQLLGHVQAVNINGKDIDHGGRFVINIFGQLNYGRDGKCYTRYDALETAFDKINYALAGYSLAFPYGFGCGLAGGDWATVYRLIRDHLYNTDITIYYRLVCPT